MFSDSASIPKGTAPEAESNISLGPARFSPAFPPRGAWLFSQRDFHKSIDAVYPPFPA